MKMKKFLLLISLVVFQIYAAAPRIVCGTGGNSTNYRVAAPSLPDIKIRECMGCGEDASQKCSTCKLTYYCSQDCQSGHWASHKTGCKKLATAHQGDIATMRSVFAAHMAKASQTKEKKWVQEGLAWHYKTIVRVRQDAACSKDASTKAGSISTVQVEHGMLFEQLVAQEVCTQGDLEDREAFKGAVAWARQITEQDALVSPIGIRRYGMQVFIASLDGAGFDQDTEFIPEAEWKEKRLGVLDQYEAQQEQE